MLNSNIIILMILILVIIYFYQVRSKENFSGNKKNDYLSGLKKLIVL